MKSKQYRKAEAEHILIAVGLMYDKSKMLSGDRIVHLVGGMKKTGFIHAPKYGKRAWKVIGRKKTLIVWDCGNDWYQIVRELKSAKGGSEK